MKRKGLISILAVSALSFATVGMTTLQTAKAENQAESEIAWLEDGASVRFGAVGNGLRFTMQIKASEFDETATYGILIAPEDGYTLSEENVFGTNAIYNWAVKGEDGNWTYTPETGKIQIVNLITEGFNDDVALVDGAEVAVKEFYGSLVNLNELNIAKEFRAVGYIRTGTEGNYDYTLVGDSDNVRSMAYVAQLAIEDTTDTAPTAAQKTQLQTMYVDKVTNNPASYTQEYYLQQANGEYVKIDELTETLNEYNGVATTIADPVAFVGKDISGYEQVSGKGKLSGNVYANDKLVLKAYYNAVEETQDLGLIDVTQTQSVSVAELTGATKKLYKVYGETLVEVADITEDALDITSLSGQYKVCGIGQYGGVASSITFDAYTADEQAVWSDGMPVEAVTLGTVNSDSALTKTSVQLATDLPDGAADTQYYKVTGGAERYAFTLNSLHSKAYYEQYTGLCLYLTFDYYMEAESLDENVTLQAMQTGVVGTSVWTDVNCNVWTKGSVALETLLANWDEALLTIGDFYKSVDGEIGAIVGGSSAVKESRLYIGNFALKTDLSSVEAIQGESRMVEVENGEYNLENLLTESEAVQFAGFKAMGNVTWKLTAPSYAVTLNGNTVDFATVTKRLYTVTAQIEDTLLYTAEIDFYNANEFLWNDVIAVEELRLKTGNNIVGISEVENPAGATGTYYQLTFGETASAAHIIYEPAHTKAYYELFYNKNISIKLDYYLDVANNNTNVTFCGYSGGKQRAGRTWLTETVAFDTIYDRWDKFNGSSTGWQDSLMQINGEPTNINVYVGNFRAILSAGDVVTETAARLIDLKGVERYNLHNVLEAAEVAQETYANKTLIWTLTPTNGDESVVITDGKVDNATFEKRAYNATASLSVYGLESPIYSGVLDFYDSSEGVIWNTSYSANDIIAKKDDTAVTGVATNPGGKTGKYYQIDITSKGLSATFVPSHTKAYYEQYTNANVILYLEFYFECETSEYLNTPLTNDSGINRKRLTWHQDNIPLDYLFSRWDSIMDPKIQGGWEQVILTCANSNIAATFYVGGFHFGVSVSDSVNETTERLVDLNGATTYDLSGVLTTADVNETVYKDKSVVWTLTSVYGGTPIQIPNGVVDFTKVGKKLYDVTASIEVFGMQAPFYTGKLDFYDVNDGLVWNTMSDVNSLVLADGATGSLVDISTVTDVNANTGTYFQSSATSFNKIMVMPEHSLGYYELFLTEKDYTLSYQFAFIAYKDGTRCTYATGGHSACTHSGSSHAGSSGRCDWYQFASKAWKTVDYKLSALISSWSSLKTKVFLTTGGTNYTVTGYSGGQSATECRIYVGGFTFAEIAETTTEA